MMKDSTSISNKQYLYQMDPSNADTIGKTVMRILEESARLKTAYPNEYADLTSSFRKTVDSIEALLAIFGSLESATLWQLSGLISKVREALGKADFAQLLEITDLATHELALVTLAYLRFAIEGQGVLAGYTGPKFAFIFAAHPIATSIIGPWEEMIESKITSYQAEQVVITTSGDNQAESDDSDDEFFDAVDCEPEESLLSRGALTTTPTLENSVHEDSTDDEFFDALGDCPSQERRLPVFDYLKNKFVEVKQWYKDFTQKYFSFAKKKEGMQDIPVADSCSSMGAALDKLRTTKAVVKKAVPKYFGSNHSFMWIPFNRRKSPTNLSSCTDVSVASIRFSNRSQ